MDLHPSPSRHAVWLAGPDAGGRHPLPVGRHLVGRAPAATVRCDDPALEPHQALLDVRADGTVTVTQLTGRRPVRVDGRVAEGAAPVATGAAVEVGGSTLVVLDGPCDPGRVAPRRGTLVRAPRPLPRWEPADLPEAPPPVGPPERPGGLTPALAGLAGAGILAAITRQPMFLLFGALGGVVALAGWVAQWIAGRRRARRARAEREDALTALDRAQRADAESFAHHRRATVPTLAAARRAMFGEDDTMWNRRADDPDAFVVSPGWVDEERHGVVLPDLPLAVSLAPSERVAVAGPAADAAARALLLQLAAGHGPADLRMVVVTTDSTPWRWLSALPHVRLPDGTAAVVDGRGLPDALDQWRSHRGHVLVVTDDTDALVTRTSPVRRALTDANALLAVVRDGPVPPCCRGVLTTSVGPHARWVADTTATHLPVPVRLVGAGVATAARCVEAIADLVDPEDPLADDATLPTTVTLLPLLALPIEGTATELGHEIATRWATAGAWPAACTPIGRCADGVVDIDLDRDGPHALVAGTTGSGKSELLRTLVAGLAANVGPRHLAVVLVDYKGGAAFDAVRHLPHVVGVVTDLDDALADRALRSLRAELRRREAVLRAHGAVDLASLARLAPEATLPRLLVVIDEFAALVAEQPEFLHALVGVAQRGRSLGVHLVLATQRPQGVISDDIRANTDLRIALRLQDTADAVDVVGDPAPATLSRRVPGRAVMRLGADEHLTFQAAHAPIDALRRLVAAVGEAAESAEVGRPAAPWTEPLPAVLEPSDVAADAIGVVDDPDHQRRVALRWSPEDGSIVVAGSAGAGVTATLVTLTAHALRDPSVHAYVVSERPDEAVRALATHPRVALVGPSERERFGRVVRRLLRRPESDERRLLVVDGLDGVRRSLGEPDRLDDLDRWDELVSRADERTVLLVGTDHPAALPAAVLTRCATRWVMHLHDPHDASVLGVAAREVPGPVPGRVAVAGTGLAAQLVRPGRMPLHDLLAGTAMPPVDDVPALLGPLGLGSGVRTPDGVALPVGVDLDDAEPARLLVPDGEHVLVIGGARSGRSTTLGRLARAWREATPAGRVIAVLPRRSRFDRSLAHHVVDRLDDAIPLLAGPRGTGPIPPTLFVCDDADVTDDDGRLAALLTDRPPHLTVLAAARPDALRHAFGHWTGIVRRSRIGVVQAGGADTDGDLLGVVLPRRIPVDRRPGLMWLVADGEPMLVQVAVDPERLLGSVAAVQ